MKKYLPFAFAITGLLILGAGCQTSAPAIETPSTAPVPVPVPTESAPPTPLESPKSTTSTNMPSSITLKFPGVLPEKDTHGIVTLKTNKGDITFEVLPKEGPKAASNFVYLVKQKYYDGLTFHRIVPGFVVQGGDPTGSGSGGPGYQFEDDVVHLPRVDSRMVNYAEGVVAMANAGPNTNGSQFFIMLADNPMPPLYSYFGRVLTGMDVVKKLTQGDTMTTVLFEVKK